MKSKQRGFITLPIILAILVLAVGSGVYIYNKKQPSPKQPVEISKLSQAIFITSIPTSAWRGSKVAISWASQSAPENGAVTLVLYDANGGNMGVIQQDLNTSGSYSWPIPTCTTTTTGNVTQPCYRTDSNAVYETPPGTYKVVAELYSPKGGYGGNMILPSKQLKTIAISSGSSITIR